MKKLFYILLLLVSTVAFSQSNTITYQAVIYLPSGQNAPGVDVTNLPMTNKNICLQFSFIDANNRVEYQEEIKVKTDEFGMVNITIGNGDQSGGYASSFDAIVWNASVQKNLQVALDARGLCNQFEILSNEPIASVPFANAAITAGNVSGVVALANGGTGATTAAAARTNLGIGNVDNTSDLNKPLSTATKTYVDTAIAGATIVDADATTKGKIQLAGDLAGTAAAPTVPGLALKENAANKSTTTTLGTSDVLFPTQNAVKTYVDTAIAGATIVDADATTKGKLKLAGDLAGKTREKDRLYQDLLQAEEDIKKFGRYQQMLEISDEQQALQSELEIEEDKLQEQLAEVQHKASTLSDRRNLVSNKQEQIKRQAERIEQEKKERIDFQLDFYSGKVTPYPIEVTLDFDNLADVLRDFNKQCNELKLIDVNIKNTYLYIFNAGITKFEVESDEELKFQKLISAFHHLDKEREAIERRARVALTEVASTLKGLRDDLNRLHRELNSFNRGIWRHQISNLQDFKIEIVDRA